MNLAYRLKLWSTWGSRGTTDAAVFATAFSQEQLVVTVNVGDFITLAAGVDLHPGVIVLREAELSAALQWERLKTALAFAEQACNGDLMHAIPPEHVN